MALDDSAGDEAREQTFRGLVQQSLLDYARTLVAADQALRAFAGQHRIQVDREKAAPLVDVEVKVTPDATNDERPEPSSTLAAEEAEDMAHGEPRPSEHRPTADVQRRPPLRPDPVWSVARPSRVEPGEPETRRRRLADVLKNTIWSRIDRFGHTQTVTLHADGATTVNWTARQGHWEVTEAGHLVLQNIGNKPYTRGVHAVTDHALLWIKDGPTRYDGKRWPARLVRCCGH